MRFPQVIHFASSPWVVTYDIGFQRKICKNGLIVPNSVIRFKFNHGRRDLGSKMRFDVARERVEKLKSDFDEFLGALRACAIPRVEFEPLAREVLSLQKPDELKANSREADAWAVLGNHLCVLSDRYAAELGENGYAVLNTITEFSSHPPVNRHVHRDRHGYQRLAGAWLVDFSQSCRQAGFMLPKYMSDLRSQRRTIADREDHGNASSPLRFAEWPNERGSPVGHVGYIR